MSLQEQEPGVPDFLLVKNRDRPFPTKDKPMPAKPKYVAVPSRDLAKEIAAAAALKDQLRAILGEENADAVTLKDMIEGETDLFGAVDAVVAQIGEDMARVEGLGKFETTLAARKHRLENRIGILRAMLTNSLDILDVKKFERPIATVTLKAIPPKLNVTDEAAVPSRFYVTPDPQLSKKTLGDELKDRAAAIEDGLATLDALREAGELTEETYGERKDALLADHPPIPGAELDNGGVTVQIRFG